MSGQTTKVDFRGDIEGLRAIAILLVVAFHVGIPAVPSGFIGVDVFFVVSGYLITLLLVQEVESTGRLSLLHFYARRVRRLLPASVLTLLVTVLAGYLFLSPVERQLHARTAFAAALYVSNIWFQRQVLDYFAGDSKENPILHTWSLSVEEQFYFVWPLLILLSFGLARSKRALAGVVVTIIATSFASCLWLRAIDQAWAFFSSPMRAWEFGVGGAAAIFPLSYLVRFDRWRRRLGWLGLLSILASATLLDATTAFPSAATILPVLGTATILLSGAGSPSGASTVSALEAPPLQLVGRLSYSWYLWHWPILFFGGVVVPSLTLQGRISLAIISLGVAAASHVLIENPIRFSRFLKLRPVLTLLSALVATGAAAGISRVAYYAALGAASTPKQRAIVDASFGSPRRLHDAGCFLTYADEQPPECTFGDTRSSTVVALFGDSHAAQWFSAFEAIANEQGWKLIVFTKAGCPTPQVQVSLWTMNDRNYPECSTWRDAVLSRIVVLRPALVVLGNSDNHVTSPDPRARRRLSLQQWREGTRMTLNILEAARIPVLIMRDTPTLRFDVIRCLSRAQAAQLPISACEAERKIALREDVFQATQEVVKEFSQVSTLDLSGYICDAQTCPAMRSEKIVYRDAGHINDGFARSLAGEISQRIVPTLRQGR